ncbi:MAG TPA: 50S ribosomal protein L25/general stress protein Ctc [Pseudomonadales bacterium]|nr:50S ribosomal protein L25/general stress protein Ctc [Pseudomonadales bacterium]HNL24086.1 50S ribosomal protein L25/general stress protein Ctc [Pseudomonadales bacterium]
MSAQFELEAELRQQQGTGASRRLRRLENRVPAILYGGGKDPVLLSCVAKDLAKSLESEAFYTHIINLKIGGSSEPVLLKALQRHPSKGSVMHADFMRVEMNRKIHVHVPLHFINEENCIGIKRDGGRIAHTLTEVEISCLPGDLPEYLEVDMLDVGVGRHIHLSDLQLPPGVELVALSQGGDHDAQVVAVVPTKGGGDEAGG